MSGVAWAFAEVFWYSMLRTFACLVGKGSSGTFPELFGCNAAYTSGIMNTIRNSATIIAKCMDTASIEAICWC